MIAEPAHGTADKDPNEEHRPAGKVSMTANRSTERVRLHRERRRVGLTPLTIEIYDKEVDDLVDHGLLPAGERNDRAAVAQAVGRVLDLAFRLLRGGWLPKG